MNVSTTSCGHELDSGSPQTKLKQLGKQTDTKLYSASCSSKPTILEFLTTSARHTFAPLVCWLSDKLTDGQECTSLGKSPDWLILLGHVEIVVAHERAQEGSRDPPTPHTRKVDF